MIQGDAARVRFRVFAKDAQHNIVSVPLSSFHDYHVNVYRMEGLKKKLIQTYKKDGPAPFVVIPVLNPDNEAIIILSESLTSANKAARYFAEFRYEVNAGQGFVNGLAFNSKDKLDIANFEQSASPNSTV